MREIKFRAWEKHKKEMIRVTRLSFDEEEGIMVWDWGNGDFGWFTADEYILMQYTGLKDSQGKDIYEGDIVKWPSFGTNFYREDFLGEVRWTLGLFEAHDDGHCTELMYDIYQECEVIGNIYEHRELLGE